MRAAASALLAALLAACATTRDEPAPVVPPAPEGHAADEVAVYRCILAAPEFRRFCAEWLAESQPHVDEELIATLSPRHERWDIDHFESWEALSRMPAPDPGGPPLRLPVAALAGYAGRGYVGVRFSRVGFDGPRRRATVVFEGVRFGLAIVGGHIDLDRQADGSSVLVPIETGWVLAA